MKFMHFFNILEKNAAAAAMNFLKIYRCRAATAMNFKKPAAAAPR